MVRYMVGVDGSRIAHKAFEVVASLMDDRNDELVVVNLYRVQKVGKIQFHLKDSPIVRIPLCTTLKVKDDGTVWTHARDVQEEQCIVFIDGQPTDRVNASVYGHKSNSAGMENLKYSGYIYQSPDVGFEKVFEGKYARDSLDKEVNIETANKDFHYHHGTGADRAEDLHKPVDMLSPANRPTHIKDLFESKCIEFHILKYKVLIEPKPEGTTTKDMLVQLAHKHEVDYMVLGSFGTKNRTNILGSSVDWFMEHARVPLIIVRNSSHVPKREDNKRLVMFVDNSNASEWAFERACKDFCCGQAKAQNQLLGYTIYTEGDDQQLKTAGQVQDKFNQEMSERGVNGTVRAVTRRMDVRTAGQIADIGFDTSADFLIVAQHHQKKWARGGMMSNGGGTFGQVLQIASGTTISYRMPAMSL